MAISTPGSILRPAKMSPTYLIAPKGREILFNDGTFMEVLRRREKIYEDEINNWGKFRTKYVEVELLERPDLLGASHSSLIDNSRSDNFPLLKSDSGTSADLSNEDAARPFKILDHPGESGDRYVAPGAKGAYGAAGLLIRNIGDDGVARYLMTKSALGFSEGKWKLPGGILYSLERPAQGPARETSEKVGIDQAYLDRMRLAGEHVVNGPNDWKYTNFAATAPERFVPTIDGYETSAAGWIPHNELVNLVRQGKVHSALSRELDSILKLFESSE
ncbi:NUDIX domain-containing protein [Nocardia sp. NPDC057030]|uniref:NUDIX domain-containing protein n=1 Tax=unclassified Nocardia TaxID=2637762 RepID=UPI00363A9183